MRALKLTAGLGAAIILLALLAAWQLPPRLDWNRYRGEIASFASARLGRQVSIGGQVRLLLLPEAVLVADRVTLADRGDGISAAIGALRLRISIAALLQGRVLPRRLELDDPVVTLPWPLPRGAAQVVPARLAGGFTASVEGGSLRLGGVALNAISAAVRTDPDTGAFAAQGSARLGDLAGSFTALVGAAGPDGVSLLTVSLDGKGRAQGTGGSLRGRILAGGSVSGELALRGPDLSRLVAGPPVPWQLKGSVSATAAQMRADKLAVMLGDSPGGASATLQLGATPKLDATLHVGQLKLDGWGWPALAAAPSIPTRLEVSVTAAALMNGTIHDLHVGIALANGAAVLHANGVLPGGAALHLDGDAKPGPGGEAFSGTFSLPVPDLPRLVTWLRPLAPAVVDALPALPVSGSLGGKVTIGAGHADFADLSGQIAGGAVSGRLSLAPGLRPKLDATLSLDRLTLPLPALPDDGRAGWWRVAQGWPAVIAKPFTGFDATLDISAATASLGGLTVSRLALQGQGGADGFLCRRLAADLPGAHVEISGAFGPDGGVRDGRLDLAAVDAAALHLPVKLPPALWKGPLHVALTAAGPAQAISGQLRGDLGDLRAEAEVGLNTQEPKFKATMTLRHPGAPRLLELAGVAGGGWVGQGSVALLAHITASPGQIAVGDFSLGAGALRLDGQLQADMSGATPGLSGWLDAPVLTLPALDTAPAAALPLWLLQGWQGQLRVAAGHVLAGLSPVAANATGTLTLAQGDALLDGVSMDVAGGRFTGTLAADSAVALPVFALQGSLTKASIDDLPDLPGLVFKGGTVDIAADLDAAGHTPAALLATLRGGVHGALSGAALQGIDLPVLTRLLAERGKRLRGALTTALSSGESGPLAGDFEATLDNGAWTFGAATLTGPSGSLAVSGAVDLSARSPDLLVRAMPAVPKPPVLPVRILPGHRLANPQPGLSWAGRK